MFTAHPITPAYRDAYATAMGEPPFCAFWQHDPAINTCPGAAEVLVEIATRAGRNLRITVCRQCASGLAAALRDSVEMVDLHDISTSTERQ